MVRRLRKERQNPPKFTCSYDSTLIIGCRSAQGKGSRDARVCSYQSTLTSGVANVMTIETISDDVNFTIQAKLRKLRLALAVLSIVVGAVAHNFNLFSLSQNNAFTRYMRYIINTYLHEYTLCAFCFRCFHLWCQGQECTTPKVRYHIQH